MTELNKLQKILIKQWFNKYVDSPFTGFLSDCSQMTNEVYEMIRNLNITENFAEKVNQYIDELNGAL